MRILLRTIEDGVNALYRYRVGPRNNQHVRVLPRVNGSSDLACHVVGRDYRLTTQMPATFWKRLVLQLDRSSPLALQPFYRLHDIEGVAIAGIRINYDWQIDARAHRGQR
ncbi:hypothetical protein MnTg04_00132 [bacterium MnTg04]|nr:hypothetical protein MnTg04_00132 [bacterium MnTg04]